MPPRCATCGQFVAFDEAYRCFFCEEVLCHNCGWDHFRDGDGEAMAFHVDRIGVNEEEVGLRLDGDLDNVDLDNLRVAPGNIVAMTVWMTDDGALAVPVVREFDSPDLAEELEREVLG